MLDTLEPDTRALVVRLIREGSARGLDLRLTSGRRSCARQNALYAQGRTTPGQVVTKAPGCRSWHVWGRAADVTLHEGGKPVWASPIYAELGALWESWGGIWGGRFDDDGHFEYHPGLRIETVCPDPAACETVTAASIAQERRAAAGGGGGWGVFAGGIAAGAVAALVMRSALRR